jgi:hypothetical protein
MITAWTFYNRPLCTPKPALPPQPHAGRTTGIAIRRKKWMICARPPTSAAQLSGTRNRRSAWTRRLRADRADHAPRQAGLHMEATPGCPVTN